MVSKFLKFLNSDIISMNRAALLLAVFSFLSQAFGLLRDHLLASLVGPSAGLDIYYAAFRIPDFIYNSFGCLFSVTVLIPFIAQYMEEEKKEETQKNMKIFLNSVFTVYTLGMIALSVLLIVIMPWLTRLTAPGFSPAEHTHLVLYSRLMLLSPFLFGLASLLSSFAQVQKKFLSFAIAPVLYNFGILIGVIFLRLILGMEGVVLGVLIGAVLYFLIQVPTLVSLNKIPKINLKIDWAIVKKVFKLSLPRTLGSSLTNITFIVMSAMASLLAIGSISIFQFSYNIEDTPLLIIGVSYAVAAFPAMTRLFTEGNKTELLDVLYRTTRSIFLFCVPISLLMIVLRAHIVRILLGAGRFSWNDTRLVAASVALFSISIVAQCMVLLMVRAYYAVGDTKMPLVINAWSALITILSSVGFLFLYKDVMFFHYFLNSLMRIDGTGGATVIMLPLGFSIGQIFNAIALWIYFRKKFPDTKTEHQDFNRVIYHFFAAGIIASAAAYGILVISGTNIDQHRFLGIFTQATIATIIGTLVYIFVLKMLRNEDIDIFIGTLKSRFWKERPVIIQQQQDL